MCRVGWRQGLVYALFGAAVASGCRGIWLLPADNQNLAPISNSFRIISCKPSDLSSC
jgi:hypothetical protein